MRPAPKFLAGTIFFFFFFFPISFGFWSLSFRPSAIVSHSSLSFFSPSSVSFHKEIPGFLFNFIWVLMLFPI
ncbi:hypothetical protein Csa_012921 [Cucumis sativus]|uniref:Uncharacterized protein n=1 Tax=Cucumis sativus TaxID=3659 RepID=A0A0A0L1K0_CUCSA|nr:hypothetical protein Csa_012921 [Cucumis sativus]